MGDKRVDINELLDIRSITYVIDGKEVELDKDFISKLKETIFKRSKR